MKAYQLNNQIINIGEWDFQKSIENDVEIIGNPLPEGAEEIDIEVIETEDGIFAKDSNQHIIFQINQLESEITPRRRDEAILGEDKGWLKAQRAKIAELRDLIQG